jgi:hypothetical protein
MGLLLLRWDHRAIDRAYWISESPDPRQKPVQSYFSPCVRLTTHAAILGQ